LPTTNIPDPDHLLRHVKSRLVDRDPQTGAAIGLLPQAFELTPDERGLSASWLEFFGDPASAQPAAAMAEFAAVYDVRKNDRFACGAVGDIKAACGRFNLKVRVVHDGDGHPSHASVRRFGGASLELLDLLAAEAWAEIVAPTSAALQISKVRAKAR